MFSYPLLEAAYRKPKKMVKCTFKKLGKYKMNKEAKTSLPETKAQEGRRGQGWCLLCGVFWIEPFMLCGSVPGLGVILRSCVPPPQRLLFTTY